MTGTDPDQGKSRSGKQRPFDSTQPYVPPEAANAPPLPPNLPSIPGISLHYEIARGGMGVVYSGRQDFLDRRVAVKLLSVELGGEAFVQRFQREAKILAGVKHPNIVGCHLAGTADDGQSYLVMEFIDGPSLKKWIADHGPLSVPAALRLTRAVAQALAHAYQLGIIHRDVKPENILLETVTSTALDIVFPFTPKLVDLGLARASSGSASLGLTSPGSVMGTPATMSPEQYDDPDAVDFRSDIYGLGCALYEMLVGVPAYRAKKLTEIVAQKRAAFAPDPCKDNPDVPAAVGALVQEMLATQREDRPSSYRDLDERLSALLDAIAASGRAAKTKALPVNDEGATIVSQPTPPAKTNPIFGDKKPAAPPEPPAAGKTGPGLLRTAEINFLAEGLGDAQPAAPPPPAFRDSGIKAGGTAPPAGTAPPGAVPVTAPLTLVPTPPPNPNKKKLMMIGGAVVLVAAIGIGVAMSGGSKENGGGGGGPKPEDTPKPPPVANARPTGAIKGPDQVDLGKRVDFEVEATDAEKDTLRYAWQVGGVVSARTGTSDKKVVLEFVDGLPGVSFDVAAEVMDGMGPSVIVKKSVTIRDYPARRATTGFKRSPDWKLDNPSDMAWQELSDLDQPVRCMAKKETRWATTSLGDEQYWEWTGTLESDTGDGQTPYATLRVQFEFGNAAWAVECSRTGPDSPGAPKDAPSDWRIEVMEAQPSTDRLFWRSVSPQAVVRWTEPKETDDEYRGGFSVRRQVDKLVFEICESRTLPNGEPKLGTPRRYEIELPPNAPTGTLRLAVEQGRGLFRILRR